MQQLRQTEIPSTTAEQIELTAERAQAYRSKLASDIELYQTGLPEADQSNSGPERQQQLGSSDVAEDGLNGEEVASLNDETLANYQKLEALTKDPRASFLPATNREKNTALTWLSYIDKPGGIASQLLEVFHARQKQRYTGAKDGVKTLESIVYESADYAADAIRSFGDLRTLQATLAEILNPGLTLDIVFEVDGMEGLKPLLRYAQVKQLLDSESEKPAHYTEDPLRTVEDRWATTGNGKRKAVHDRYTFEVADDQFMLDQFAIFMSSTTVKQAKRLLTEALHNEEARAMFFSQRLRDVSELSKVGPIIFSKLVDDAISLSEVSNG